MSKLLKVDSNIHSIPYLTFEDQCFYFLDYIEGGYEASKYNSLVFNFKKGLEHRDNEWAWKYRNEAIKQFAVMLHNTFYKIANRITIISMPTSKPKQSLNFNDRLIQTMQELQLLGNENYHIENCFDVVFEQMPSHYGGSRNPDELYNQIIFTTPLQSLKEYVFLVDDVLTIGGHFIACKRKILNLYPNIKIGGIFLAKTNHKNLTIL